MIEFFYFFFFFQAEDGIRDLYVTGVQTCALPISLDLLAWRRCAADALRALRARRQSAAEQAARSERRDARAFALLLRRGADRPSARPFGVDQDGADLADPVGHRFPVPLRLRIQQGVG